MMMSRNSSSAAFAAPMIGHTSDVWYGAGARPMYRGLPYSSVPGGGIPGLKIASDGFARRSGTNAPSTTIVFEPLEFSPNIVPPPQSSSIVRSERGMSSVYGVGGSPSSIAPSSAHVQYGTPDAYGNRPLRRKPPSARS